MELTRISLPAGDGSGFAIAFPSAEPVADRGSAEPKAVLSYASAGDMKFGDPSRVGNRERFLRLEGIDPGRVLGLELVHSRAVVFPALGEDSAELARRSGGADGIVLGDATVGVGTADGRPAEGRAASVTVADCMPIWILDRESGAYGILHSGWRGTGILAVALRLMAERLGTRPASVALVLGPAIGPCCYAVAEERAAGFSSEFGPGCVQRRGGSTYLDLRSANVSIAEACGVGQVLSIEACTSCDERLGSYRRQGGASFTRMIAVCGFSK